MCRTIEYACIRHNYDRDGYRVWIVWEDGTETRLEVEFKIGFRGEAFRAAEELALSIVCGDTRRVSTQT
jgi:hypothetical protein